MKKPSELPNNPQSVFSQGRLQTRVELGATMAEIAAVMAVLCQEINAALSPIVGARGVAALHQSSHHHCAASRVCKTSHCEAPSFSFYPDFAVLVALQEQPDPIAALHVGEAYLQTFCSLLESLIGASLTERLLFSVWPPASSSAASQTTP